MHGSGRSGQTSSVQLSDYYYANFSFITCSTDEAATEAILKCLELYASLCGKLGLTVNRDAFVTALCKSSLPPHYALAVLNIALPASSNTSTPKGMDLCSLLCFKDKCLLCED